MVENAEETEIEKITQHEGVGNWANPENLYILFEDRARLDKIIDKFEGTLEGDQEVEVWFNVIKTDTPWTTRDMAKELGVSPKTITNVRRRLEDRFHNIYKGN